MGCGDAEDDTLPVPPPQDHPRVWLRPVCLYPNLTPCCGNYLTVLHFHRLELSVSTPPAQQSQSVGGVWLKFDLQQGNGRR